MEAFEHVVKVYLEAQGYVVTSGAKFPVEKVVTKRDGRIEHQTHGYEVDLVAARADRLLLGSVKSFFGSRGVTRQGFDGIADTRKDTHFGQYRMFNDEKVRSGIVTGACERFGYPTEAVRMVLFVGKFAAADEAAIRKHLGDLIVGGGPVEVIGLGPIVAGLLRAMTERTYFNDPVLMTLKTLHASGVLRDEFPPDIAAAIAALDEADGDPDEMED